MSQRSDQHPTAIISAVSRPGGSPVHRAASIDPRKSLQSTISISAEEDSKLLDRYCHTRCPEAFQALVSRHIGWVQSVVRRYVKDRHLSEDVTQAIFIILARRAHTIPRGTLLSAWLFRVARFAANDAIKHESRRRRRMERLAEMQTSAQRAGIDAARLNGEALVIEPELDDALACLSEVDRQAILLRFYEDKSMAEVGLALAISEDAAKQRVSRALKRLRGLLQRKGIKVSALAGVLALLCDTSHTTHAAAIGQGIKLAEIAKVATGHAEAAGRCLRLVQATLKTIAGAQVRLWAAVAGASLGITLVVGVLSPVLREIIQPVFQSVQSALVWGHSTSDVTPIDAGPTNEAPAKDSVARLWVGSSNVSAWPILPRSAPMIPIPLRSLSGADVPVAVAQDHEGRLWYRTIEPQLFSNLTESDARYKDYDELNPYKMLEADSRLVELLPLDVLSAHHYFAVDGVEWAPVPPPEDGQYVVLPFSSINLGTQDVNKLQLVPEPASLCLSVIAAALLARRRRAHASCIPPVN